ncbi:winged helix-turn-helix domain-containing tetratricopeptide repeat protein [Chthonobacter albigriseus]|uniref:winged helix-turn-helix domain-containing tetratricopeptide repeat protein n=1 Tax=Chthonobacter albigriseus TaxID=1683161 RepID=UPI00245653C7|nr:winged helix-turn-helix domain-containing protein [Chthonobacter albigriseus]
MPPDADATLHFRGFVLNLSAGRLQRQGEDVPLRRKAFDLLTVLARRPGRVMPKGELLDAVWPDAIVTEDSLTQAIREIRKALGEAGLATIRTVAGRGYFFDPGMPEASSAGPGGDEMAIVVLPFDDRTVGASDSFALSLCDEIINGLARFRMVPVIARATAAAVAESDRSDPRLLGRTLGASHIVDGHVERRDGTVQVGIRIIDTADGSLVWADRIEAVDPDPLALEDLIARQVISRLVSRVEDAALRLAARKPPADRRAHDLLLQGMAFLRGYGADDNRIAHRVLSEALVLDPLYGLVHSYLALATVILGRYGLSRQTELVTALNLASTGVNLAPEEARTHRILGLVRLYLREHAAAEHHVARSLELNPYDADTIAQMGYLLVLRGRIEEGIAWMDRAVRLNPLHPDWYHFDRSMALYLRGDYAGAADRLLRIPRLGSWGLARLGASQTLAGNLADARETLARMRMLDPGFDPIDYATRGIAFERQMELDHVVTGIREMFKADL